MGLFSFFRGQFVEVVEWREDTNAMVYRFPAYDSAIKMGAKLIVREGQAAVFVNEGQLADVYGPGTYTLNTQNMPLLTALKSWKHKFDSPFKADVYFVNTTNYTNQKWGTSNPVIMRDAEFGLVRIRGFGSYSFRVKDPALFLREIFGMREEFTAEGITAHLKSAIVSGISDLLAESNIPVADLASSYEELGLSAAERLQKHFEAMGLALSSLTIENISLPEEVEKAIDRRSSMSIAGNLERYTRYQAAEAIREAAGGAESGMAAGAGLGAGMAMGQMLQQALNPSSQPHHSGAADAAGEEPDAACGECGHRLKPAEKFCPQCGTARPYARFCSECGEPVAASAKFCSACGTKV
jgi:membrane protease subunit (stomatin/prohibitin family)